MKSSLVKKTLATNMGTEYTIGVRPYTSSRSSFVYKDILEIAEEQGIDVSNTGNLLLVHIRLYNIMSYVADVEFPETSDDFELESFREYWANANGDVKHNYDLIMDVSDDLAKDISSASKAAIKEWESKFPKMPKVIAEGKPDDPNVSRAGGKKSSKKS